MKRHEQLHGLSDLVVRDSLHDIDPMRTFAGIEFGVHRIPDETAVLNFLACRKFSKYDLSGYSCRIVNAARPMSPKFDS